jgi:N-acetylmuramoyl-L-alanine amidase
MIEGRELATMRDDRAAGSCLFPLRARCHQFSDGAAFEHGPSRSYRYARHGTIRSGHFSSRETAGTPVVPRKFFEPHVMTLTPEFKLHTRESRLQGWKPAASIAATLCRFYDLAQFIATPIPLSARQIRLQPLRQELINRNPLPIVTIVLMNAVPFPLARKQGSPMARLILRTFRYAGIARPRGQAPRPGYKGLVFFVLAFIGAWMGLVPSASAAPLDARGYAMAGDAVRTRIVLQFDRKPDISWFLLRNPHRLVIDMPEAVFHIDPAQTKPVGLVTEVHYGQIGEGKSRLVIASDGPFDIEDVEVIKNEQVPGYRLVADITAAPEAKFEAALTKQAGNAVATGVSASDSAPRPPAAGKKRFTVVIDPGHGGIDPGAQGVSGTLEKDVTLTFGLQLRDALRKTGKYDVYMTRDDDRYLRLDERVQIARRDGADLFMSIHADTINQSDIRGATVYTLSDRASDAVAAAVAVRENLSDKLAGAKVDDRNHEVSDILVDLIRRETRSFSVRFARTLVGELSHNIELINNPQRSAGFRVLRAPDIPSVLVELGYLSNAKDEAELRDPDWRAKAVASMVDAVGVFATAREHAGG